MGSQVTTKRGDDGTTTSLGGDTVPKSHGIMEAVGAVDELRSQTALAWRRIVEESPEHASGLDEFLPWLLHVYFLIGTECSDPLRKHPEYRQDVLTQREIDRLEAEQAKLEADTPLPSSFIVSASNSLAAQVDVACAVARHAERAIVRLKEATPEFASKEILAFMNRLSDYLYMLARNLEHGNHLAVDYDVLKPES
ncbi:MAG: hypothetical protein GWP08_16215 [Nitrospiraceae bacterium]|nr:hypothetical protein [Nitrospiraceae bacterium]